MSIVSDYANYKNEHTMKEEEDHWNISHTNNNFKTNNNSENPNNEITS